MRILSTQILFSKYHSLPKGLLGGKAHSRAGPGNIQHEPRAPGSARNQESGSNKEKDGAMSKGHRSQAQ